ncbi:MAG TPA: DNA replication and repair protein RecF [Actinomycetota bacterium]|nr:DNA replication and repair protein RecF [Actinomycetota bacterium]
MIEVLRLWDLRIYTTASFRPARGTTLVVGGNGSGKSSLLEAAGLFATLSSSRAGSLKVLVRDGCDEGGTKLETVEGAALEVRLRAGRSVLRVGGSPAAAKDFLGRFRSVLFTPEDLDLVRGEPSLRRRALDDLLVQLRPRYRSVRQEFERALRQRNAALRDGLEREAALYGAPLAQAAAAILEARRAAADDLRPAAAGLYGELADRGRLDISYRDTSEAGGREGEDLVEHFDRLYASSLPSDMERGRTMSGPHRDDLDITLDGREARWYASRGEQRSATLAFRLAELRLLPGAVLLLDDVLSELDTERRRRVFEVTAGSQTIVTATDPLAVPDAVEVQSIWRVDRGSLEEAA